MHFASKLASEAPAASADPLMESGEVQLLTHPEREIRMISTPDHGWRVVPGEKWAHLSSNDGFRSTIVSLSPQGGSTLRIEMPSAFCREGISCDEFRVAEIVRFRAEHVDRPEFSRIQLRTFFRASPGCLSDF
ncbi:MAG: hypothetical protein JWM11_5042 [Planctomycetaceae bacterium]|nr:hypothetical protein [Planctomycetaceae bacterium]